jgi:hypothetical protein
MQTAGKKGMQPGKLECRQLTGRQAVGWQESRQAAHAEGESCVPETVLNCPSGTYCTVRPENWGSFVLQKFTHSEKYFLMKVVLPALWRSSSRSVQKYSFLQGKFSKLIIKFRSPQQP